MMEIKAKTDLLERVREWRRRMMIAEIPMERMALSMTKQDLNEIGRDLCVRYGGAPGLLVQLYHQGCAWKFFAYHGGKVYGVRFHVD